MVKKIKQETIRCKLGMNDQSGKVKLPYKDP